jgi:rhamnosyltransferase
VSARRADSVAAIVVLYRPSPDVAANVTAIGRQVDRVFAIDNTESPDRAVVESLSRVPNLEYIPMGSNTGIAAALNVGVEHARFAGYRWVITMDQDSTPESDMVRALLRCAVECPGPKPIGVIAPVHHIKSAPASETFDGCRDEVTVITSGDLLSVEAWEAVGRFDEGLFIDQVDHDLCLRMHRSGFSVRTCGRAAMLQRMGDMAEHRLRGPVYVSNHSALRRYYITRNRLAVTSRYRDEFPAFCASEMRAMRHELLKIVLFESDKAAKLRMAWLGYRDFRRGRSGPYRGTA